MKKCLLFSALFIFSAGFAYGDEFQSLYDHSEMHFRNLPHAPPTGKNLHVILVIDTHGRNATALGIADDGAHFIKLIGALFPSGQNGDHKVASITLIAAEEVRKSTILEKIAAVPSGPNDTLLFYYSGHGGSDKEEHERLVANQMTPDGVRYDFDDSHFLALGTGSDAQVLNRSDIKDALNKRPGQLRMILTDACASFPSRPAALKNLKDAESPGGSSRDIVKNDGENPFSSLDAKPALVEALFFNSVGWVSINAAPPGQTAPGSGTGGAFSNALFKKIQALASDIDRNPDAGHDVWRDLGQVAIKKFDSKEPLLNPGGAVNGMQDPRFIYSYVFAAPLDIRGAFSR